MAATYFDDSEGDVPPFPELPEVSELPVASDAPELPLSGLLLPEDMSAPDCELPPVLPPLLSPLRWHAASEPNINIGTSNSAKPRFAGHLVGVLICVFLSIG